MSEHDITIRNIVWDDEECSFDKREAYAEIVQTLTQFKYEMYCTGHKCSTNQRIKEVLHVKPYDILTESKYKKTKYFLFDILFTAGIRYLDLLPLGRKSYAYDSIHPEEVDHLR